MVGAVCSFWAAAFMYHDVMTLAWHEAYEDKYGTNRTTDFAWRVQTEIEHLLGQRAHLMVH